MRPFNLAESRIAERNYCRLKLIHTLKTIAALAALTGLVAMGSYACRISISNKAVRLNTGLAEIQERCLQVKQGMSSVRMRDSQRKWQEQLVQGSDRWLDVLQSVIGRVPADVWLTRIDSQAASSLITVDGTAGSYDGISVYMGRLRRYREISEIRLINSRVVPENESSRVEFTLQAKLKTAASAQPTATQGKL